jgi:uncharacterized membrane protein
MLYCALGTSKKEITVKDLVLKACDIGREVMGTSER